MLIVLSEKIMISDYLNFIEIVNKRCNIGTASRLLNISRHKLLASIQVIEAEIGTEILDKTTTPWQITAKGKEVYNQYKDIYDWHTEALATAKLQFNRKPLKMMIDSNIFSLLTHAGLVEFLYDKPGILLDTYPSHQYAAHEEMDIIIADFIPSEAKYICEKISTFKTKLFCSQAYLAKYGAINTPQDLTKHHSRLCLYKSMLKNNRLEVIKSSDKSKESIELPSCAITFTTNAFRFHDFNQTNFIFAMTDNEYTHEIAHNILPEYELSNIDNYLSVDKYAFQSREELRLLCKFIKSVNIENMMLKRDREERII